MAAHRAWFCPDVVKELSSYLPISDTISLVMCGNKILNKLLIDNNEYCLSITIRDAKSLCLYINIFVNIRFVFIKGQYHIGNGSPYISHPDGLHIQKIPKTIERFIAPLSHIYGLSFGSNVKYINTKYTEECDFDSPPEQYVNLYGEYKHKYLTHIRVGPYANILSHTDEEYATLYPYLKEIEVYNRSPSDDVVSKISQRVKITHICSNAGDDGKCTQCGKQVSSIYIRVDQDVSRFAGVTQMGIINCSYTTLTTIPSSVTSLYLYGNYNIESIKNLLRTLINIKLSGVEITENFLLSINPDAESTIITRCLSEPEDIVRIVASNCHKIQVSALEILKTVNNKQFPREYINMLEGNYHMTVRNDRIIFERVRARASE